MNEKTSQEKAMKDALAKADAAWRDQEGALKKAIQAMRSNLEAARSECDKIRGSAVAKESDLQKVCLVVALSHWPCIFTSRA
jgi:hypothetical protein